MGCPSRCVRLKRAWPCPPLSSLPPPALCTIAVAGVRVRLIQPPPLGAQRTVGVSPGVGAFCTGSRWGAGPPCLGYPRRLSHGAVASPLTAGGCHALSLGLLTSALVPSLAACGGGVRSLGTRVEGARSHSLSSERPGVLTLPALRLLASPLRLRGCWPRRVQGCEGSGVSSAQRHVAQAAAAGVVP